jgi:type IV fimbrial biogenesis protein FimT
MAREGRASNSAHNNNRRGFTLLELLVALSVAAILANLSYSAFTGIIARQQQSVTVSGIRQLLRYTRYQAVSRQQKITLCALDEREKCQKTWSRRRITVFDDINSNHQLDTGEEILQERQWPSERGQLT